MMLVMPVLLNSAAAWLSLDGIDFSPKTNAMWKYSSGDTTGCTRPTFAPAQNAANMLKKYASSLAIAQRRLSLHSAVKVK